MLNKPLFINTKRVYIQEEIPISVVHNKYGGFLLFHFDEKLAQAECYKVSDEYRRICDRKLSGGIIKASNIELLDIRNPRLKGIFLSGRFVVGSEVINLDITNNSEAINNYIFQKKVELSLVYIFLCGSFLCSIFFFFKLKPN